MSRGDEPVPISESLTRVVQALAPDSAGAVGAPAAAMGGVFGRWEDAVGASVAAHVRPVKLDGTRLVVQVDDPAWATELRFLEATLKRRVHEVTGAVVEVLDVRVARR